MAKRIRHTTQRNNTIPSNRTMHVNTTSLRETLRKNNFKEVIVTPDDNLYLGGVLYTGNAFLKPNNRHVVAEKTTSRNSNKYIDLIKKIPSSETIPSRRTMSRKIKAALTTNRNKQKNIREKIRIENAIKSNRGRNNKFVQKIKRRRITK